MATRGFRRLTPREQDVYVLAVGETGPGCSAAEIATVLGISIGTVRAHLSRIYRVMRVRDLHRLVVKHWRAKLRRQRRISSRTESN